MKTWSFGPNEVKSLGAKEGTVRNRTNGNERLRSNIIGASFMSNTVGSDELLSCPVQNYLDWSFLVNVIKVIFVYCKY